MAKKKPARRQVQTAPDRPRPMNAPLEVQHIDEALNHLIGFCHHAGTIPTRVRDPQFTALIAQVQASLPSIKERRQRYVDRIARAAAWDEEDRTFYEERRPKGTRYELAGVDPPEAVGPLEKEPKTREPEPELAPADAEAPA